MRRIRVCFVVAVVCLLAVDAWVARAQTGLGAVRGTVMDATRAAVPNARLSLTNTATGVTQTTQSNAVGIYYFGSVPLGQYKLSVEASGFKRWSGTLRVEAGQTVVVEPVLEVGAVEAVVEVTGAAPVVTTVGMELNDVKDALRIQQLPLNGRFIANLFSLTPGVEGGGSPRVNGMKVGSAEMLLDGTSLVDRFGGGIVRVQPGLDTIQEYRIETAGSNAQYSRPATITLVTKSGTNELHGSAFWTHRNNFGGLRARQRQDFYTRPPQYIRNEFGASAGGPVVKNKTFWFVAYEGQRERQANYARASVPTAAIWEGDFSGAITEANVPLTIYDPLSTGVDGRRLPFVGNRIPRSRITKFAETMRSVSAMPAGPNAGGNPWIETNFEAYYPNRLNINTLTLKLDHMFSEKDNISGRLTYSSSPYRLLGGRYGYPPLGTTDAGGTGRRESDVYAPVVRWNRVFSPNFLNELQLSSSRSATSIGTLADFTDWPAKLGLPNPFGAKGWPTICADSPFFFEGCWDADNHHDQNLTGFQVDDNVTWVRGKHTLKFGFKGRQEYNNVRELQQAQGSHDFGSDWTALYDPGEDQAVSYTGSGFASLLLGLPTYLSNQYNRGYFYFRQKEIGLYGQDSWKIHPRVTLELGLRWDKWTVYKEKYNRLVNLDLRKALSEPRSMEVVTVKNLRMEDLPGIPPAVLASWRARGLTWTTARQAGLPDGLLPSDNNNLAPRLGAAVRITDGWVMRGGYGIYYWTMPLSQILQSARTNPPLNLRFSNDIANKNGRIFNYALKSVPAADDMVGGAIVDTTGIAGIPSTARSFMVWDFRDWRDNMMQEWTFSLERQLMKETSLRLSYVGNRGSNLEQRFYVNTAESEWNYQARTGRVRPANPDLRRVNPNWSFEGSTAPLNHSGFSNSHSLQAEVERRYWDGLAFQWFYTWTHAMTTNDTGGFSYGPSSFNATGSTGFGVPENWNILGAPNLTYWQRLRLGYMNSAEVPAHRIRWNGIYSLPVGRGKRYGGSVSRGLDAVVGGWEIAFIGDWRSGYWSSVSSGRYLFGDPTLSAEQRLEMTIFGRRQRLWFRGDFDPALASNVDRAKLQQLVPADRSQRVLRPVGDRFDNRIPQRLADGTVRYTSITDMVNWNARNFFRGPGAWNLDLSLFKSFALTERIKARITADFFNVFNHPVDVAPDATTGLQDLSRQSNQPRIIQFSLRVSW